MVNFMKQGQDTTSKAIGRALSILEEVAENPNGLTHAELSRRLDIPKSTLSYLLPALESRGYLKQEMGRFSLGLQVLQLSHALTAHLDLRAIALPHLRRFVGEMGFSVQLSILEGGRAVYIEKLEGEGFVRMNTWIGKRLAVHTTAVGKVLTAWLPKDEALDILQKQGMERITPETIVTPARFLLELERVRRLNYAYDNEENSIGVRCVAAPILNDRGQIVAACGTSGTTSQIGENNLEQIAGAIQKCALAISRDLGYRVKESQG